MSSSIYWTNVNDVDDDQSDIHFAELVRNATEHLIPKEILDGHVSQ